MIRRKQAISVIVGAAVATGAVVAAAGLAHPSSSLKLTNVGSAPSQASPLAIRALAG